MKTTFKKYKQRKTNISTKTVDNWFVEKAFTRLYRKGIWQKMSPKMRREFYKHKNWEWKQTKKGAPYFTFKKLKRYQASIKGMERHKFLRSMEGLNEMVKQYHQIYEKFKDTMTLQQEKILRKMKNTLLWSQLQNAKTQQRKETLKQQIKIFKEDDLGRLFQTGTFQRIDFTTFILTYKPELIEKYQEYFKEFTGREGNESEIISIYKEDMITDLGLTNLKRGKNGIQEGAYWDEYSDSIIYLDI